MSLIKLRWRDWPLGFKSLAAVAVPMALLLFALFSSYRLQQQINVADANLRRALAIQTDIQTLHVLIAEAATGVRGFLLTDRDDFLEPYRNTQEELPRTLQALSVNIRDPEVRAYLQKVRALWARKQESLEVLRQTGRRMPPTELRAHLIDSKQILDALRQEIQAMYAREAELVGEYSAAASAAFLRNLWVDAVTSLLVLLSGIAAFLLLLSGIVRRVQSLAVNAERLSRGEPLEALPAARDELGLLAERLQNASALLASRVNEANSASLAKTRFLSRTSHELRTPLNAILGFAQLLESDLQHTHHSAHVEQILIAGRHLLTLIDEVLDIARIESGDIQLSLESQGLREITHEVLDLLGPLAVQKGVSFYLAPELSALYVMADRQRLRQVLINLVSNAIKYNRPAGEVHIDASLIGEEARIMVRDTGVGIRAELLPRLFSPFERLDAEQAGVEGTGLGLALSRQLMLHMRGDIEVQSTLGRGSTFSLRLVRAHVPVTAVSASNSSPCEAVNIVSDTLALRPVLVIEDNPSNLALIQALLARRPQWRMLTAGDGESGLRAARRERPELILLDLHLPGMAGESVLAELRADPAFARTPVVVISADALPSTVERVLAAGANKYLTKPIEVQRFLSLLDDIES